MRGFISSSEVVLPPVISGVRFDSGDGHMMTLIEEGVNKAPT